MHGDFRTPLDPIPLVQCGQGNIAVVADGNFKEGNETHLHGFIKCDTHKYSLMSNEEETENNVMKVNVTSCVTMMIPRAL